MVLPRPEVLVDTAWLADRLDDPSIRVIEVDEDTTAYQKGHIRNAVAWNWSEDLHAKPRRDYIGPEALGHLLGRCGVGPQTTVILYGGNNNWFAAYAFWLLRYRGFDQVKLLDGGRKRWELESRELTTAEPAVAATDFRVPNPVRPELRAMRDQVLSGLGGPTVLIDVRSPEEYRGEMMAPAHLPQESAMVAGHIPGAKNVPWSRAANEDGTFKSDAELRDLYAAQDVDDSTPVIAYCRIGERSAHTWFVLHELLGYPHVANYDGSWTEYGSMVAVPVEW